MESNKGRGSLTNRYLAALLAPAVAAGVMQVTWPFFQHNPVLPYLLAVIFCAWYGGLGPGLLSLVISFLLTDFFFIEPYFFFWFPKQVDLVRLLIFAVVGPFISVMSELMHKQRRRAGINLESAKRAEGSLREKERFANQIAELSSVVFDLATRRDVYISPAVVNLLGYTPDEVCYGWRSRQRFRRLYCNNSLAVRRRKRARIFVSSNSARGMLCKVCC